MKFIETFKKSQYLFYVDGRAGMYIWAARACSVLGG